MNILCVADIHNKWNRFNQIEKELQQSDLLIICGDISNFVPFLPQRPGKKLEQLSRKTKRLLAVFGNHDRPGIVQYLENNKYTLHGIGLIIDEIGFFGVGGSCPSILKFPGELQDDITSSMLIKSYESVMKAKTKVMITHCPPFGTAVDFAFNKKHIGSKVVRDFIEKEQPDVCLCGHVHEAFGQDKIGKTLIINPGPLKKGYYALLHFNGQIFNVQLKKMEM